MVAVVLRYVVVRHLGLGGCQFYVVGPLLRRIEKKSEQVV